MRILYQASSWFRGQYCRNDQATAPRITVVVFDGLASDGAPKSLEQAIKQKPTKSHPNAARQLHRIARKQGNNRSRMPKNPLKTLRDPVETTLSGG